MRYELSDGGWATIRPMLPNKACGVSRVDDRRRVNESTPYYEKMDSLVHGNERSVLYRRGGYGSRP
jgi:hypothetical protein